CPDRTRCGWPLRFLGPGRGRGRGGGAWPAGGRELVTHFGFSALRHGSGPQKGAIACLEAEIRKRRPYLPPQTGLEERQVAPACRRVLTRPIDHPLWLPCVRAARLCEQGAPK